MTIASVPPMAGVLTPSSGVGSCPSCELEIIGGGSLQMFGVFASFGAVCLLYLRRPASLFPAPTTWPV